jgi:DNA replication protein DnaC
MLRLLTGPNLAAADIFAFHAEHEERVRQMTQDQTAILGFLRNQHRVAVVGGAGSGKTWLALEQTRRLAKSRSVCGPGVLFEGPDAFLAGSHG